MFWKIHLHEQNLLLDRFLKRGSEEINKSQSIGDVNRVNEIDLCFAYAAFREATVQTALSTTSLSKSSLLTLCWNKYNILIIEINIYLCSFETLLLLKYLDVISCSFLFLVDAFPNYLRTVEYWYRRVNQIDVVNIHWLEWSILWEHLCIAYLCFYHVKKVNLTKNIDALNYPPYLTYK